MDPDLELLAEISGAVEVRLSPGKGKGTFAKEFVPKGTRLISERPILRMSSNYFNDETLKKMVQNLPTTERRDFEDLHCPICQPEQALRQKYIVNHFSLSVPQIGICLQGSRINHSCLPNAYSSWNDKKDRFMIHAIADIQEGDEVTISYCDALATKDMRSKWLEVYQFSCECAACRTTDPNFQQREKIHKRIEELIQRFAQLSSQQHRCPDSDGLQEIMEYVCILQEEKFQGVELLFAYHRAAQCYHERGMKDEALYFADKAVDTAKCCFGLDSYEADSAEELLKNLSRSRWLFVFCNSA